MAALLARPPHGLSWLARCPQPLGKPLRKAPASRWLSTSAGDLGRLLDHVSQPPPDAEQKQPVVHIVHSVGRNPFANLAIEHRLFERAHAESRLLLLYRNSPCVVIGRNQNPWTEVNLNRLSARASSTPGNIVQLVRRRSGGGAVYHDAGNANWSVHIPSAGFDRDQHALMVARALQQLGVASARVNERHDIVVGAGTSDDGTYKISGSAYKLTSRRAMHHGTCLLGADLAAVSGLLRAPPAAPYLKARGVASVRSPVRNVTLAGEEDESAHDPHDHFGATVAAEFERMYGPAASNTVIDMDALAAEKVGDAGGFAFDPQLAKGYNELMTTDWLFGQTPQFTFSTQPTEEDPRERPLRPLDVPPHFDLAFTARHGRLQDVVLSGLPYAAIDDTAGTSNSDYDRATAAALEGRLLYEIRDWRAVLAGVSLVPLDTARADATGSWLNELFGVQCY